ncbi:hypothetical protein OIDMADRAFT_57839 [Oidiodendron maius Zn]|uniref:Heterokaryon incompatibility domain-containing protein n=1 Tax=Oidiodendron maius (strain Zn) TaxID=913774 RepID=A0A0C3GM62_OIDMZ|nr:hypothetical protein OIDMADRAFT_57839 [Oidiodendron maius Zn]
MQAKEEDQSTFPETKTYSHLCSLCQAIFDNANEIAEEHRPSPDLIPFPFDKPTFAHHQSDSTLKKSAVEKCYICVRLINWFSKNPVMQPDDLSCPVNIRYSLTTAFCKDLKQINVWFIEGDKLSPVAPDLPIGRYVALPSREARRYIHDCDMQEPSPGTNGLFLAKQCLAYCRRVHKACSVERSSTLPTRLVKVEKIDSKISAHLCDGASLDSKTEYITLSHCWGGISFMTLTVENMEQMRKSIPIEKLSRVFQDALKVTVELGFKYIWIDSLCIIQNSAAGADWLAESTTMNRVYRDCVLNISATGFKDGQEGLFVSTQPREVIPPNIDFTRLARQGCPTDYTIVYTNEWADDVSRGPLGQRGWVYQEQVLAPRVIHFGRRQVFWECQVAAASQAFPHGWIPTHAIQNLKRKISIPTTLQANSAPEKLYLQWQTAVRDYTHRNLTYDTDKLPALSGLAEVFKHHLNDEYVAGLWKNNLLYDLLWHGSGNFKETVSYLAPTWSWACIDGPITFPGIGKSDTKWRPIAYVRHVMVKPLTSTVTGQLIGGHLRLSGFLIKPDIREFPNEIGRSLRSLRFNFRTKFTSDGPNADEQNMGFYPAAEGIGMVDLQMDPSIDNLREAKDPILMPLFYNEAHDRDAGATQGLVLRRKDANSGCYTKIGTFTLFPHDLHWKLLSSSQARELQYYESCVEIPWEGPRHYICTVKIL